MTQRAVVVVLDGLRRDMLRAATTPALADFAGAATSFAAHRSVFPSATRVVSACFATGCRPARHGLLGNSVALMEDGVLVRHDVGHPGFMDHLRAQRGRSLEVPTLAERLARAGREAMIFSNVSPGAARAHDPDGHGWVLHRAWAHGPGLRRLEGAEAVAEVTLDAAGDAMLTEAFLARALAGREAALAVLWLGEPDAMQHAVPLGAPAAMAAIAAADARFAQVRDAVGARRAAGEDILLVACSDHGHQTVQAVVDIEAELIDAGLKRDAADAGLLSVANGTAALVYLHPDRAAQAGAVLRFLATRPWAGAVFSGAALAEIGHAPRDHLLCAVAMATEPEPNEHGVPGLAYAARPAGAKPDRLGCGQHGGLGAAEQMPFLMIEGAGFAPGARRQAPSSPIDLAPTLLRHLRLPADGCDGVALQTPSRENDDD
ncbi:alkaline phosphatase family protein [Falsiroseomonas selenitidurans]|uniref:Nucleotide pyrophosphatase n=1 Tax=Falsiroseomonas selenitidurans TaxID=2716335 RepID=A0ABX1EB96_9PROT|nr:alkaline phosphatase family protein [Falsiroseomonas selenitidurans]NKC34464.1 nucleotide pyrophosphatase [Falsiroseomonas selenitidurans]